VLVVLTACILFTDARVLVEARTITVIAPVIVRILRLDITLTPVMVMVVIPVTVIMQAVMVTLVTTMDKSMVTLGSVVDHLRVDVMET
jgi:hypothetical protein